MEFEYLIWIIIFLVYVGSTIIKRLRAASRSKEEDNKSINQHSGWRKRLNQLMSQVQKKAGDKVVVTHQGHRRRDIFAEAIESANEKPTVPEQKPELPKSVAQPDETGYYQKDIIPPYFDTGKSELRKAVIWSEILAPPLALREERPK